MSSPRRRRAPLSPTFRAVESPEALSHGPCATARQFAHRNGPPRTFHPEKKATQHLKQVSRSSALENLLGIYEDGVTAIS
jgi:hypothetical protein